MAKYPTETIFHYHQDGEIVWTTYKGGAILFGNLIVKVDKTGCLDMRYQHIYINKEFMTGICCHSMPEVLCDERLGMREEWQWTSGDCSKGTSIIEEIM